MINAVAFSYQSLRDVRIELEGNARVSADRSVRHMPYEPKTNLTKDHIILFPEKQTMRCQRHLSAPAPRQVHGYRLPSTRTLSRSHSRLSVSPRIETKLVNREERTEVR
jgi:hypothetical protein